MNKNYYTGIGSRKTPEGILALMNQAAQYLSSKGWILRSGAADGADTAFEKGASNGPKEIFIPWKKFNNRTSKEDGVICGKNLEKVIPEARDLAEFFHPNWKSCGHGTQLLHTRNVFQVLGFDMKTPSKFVLCWTPGGRPEGGTATAIRIAQYHDIPVLNMGIMTPAKIETEINQIIGES